MKKGFLTKAFVAVGVMASALALSSVCAFAAEYTGADGSTVTYKSDTADVGNYITCENSDSTTAWKLAKWNAQSSNNLIGNYFKFTVAKPCQITINNGAKQAVYIVPASAGLDGLTDKKTNSTEVKTFNSTYATANYKLGKAASVTTNLSAGTYYVFNDDGNNTYDSFVFKFGASGNSLEDNNVTISQENLDDTPDYYYTDGTNIYIVYTINGNISDNNNFAVKVDGSEVFSTTTAYSKIQFSGSESNCITAQALGADALYAVKITGAGTKPISGGAYTKSLS